MHELESLVGHRWLNGGILERVIEIINNQSLDSFEYNFNVSRKAQDVPNVLYRCLQRRWPNELPKKIGFAKQRILHLACIMWNLTIHYMENLLPCLCLCSSGRFSLSFSHIYSVPKKLSDVPCNCFTNMIANHFQRLFSC